MAALGNILAAGEKFYEQGQAGFDVRVGEFAGHVALQVEDSTVQVYNRVFDYASSESRDLVKAPITFKDIAAETAKYAGFETDDHELALLELAVVYSHKVELARIVEGAIANLNTSLGIRVEERTAAFEALIAWKNKGVSV